MQLSAFYLVVNDAVAYCYSNTQCTYLQSGAATLVPAEACCQGGGGSWGLYHGDCTPCDSGVLDKIDIEHYLSVPSGKNGSVRIFSWQPGHDDPSKNPSCLHCLSSLNPRCVIKVRRLLMPYYSIASSHCPR